MHTSGSRHASPQPAAEPQRKPCVVVSEPRLTSEEPPLASRLDSRRYDIVACDAHERVLDQVIQRHPGVLVFALGDGSQTDLALLLLLRRAAPAVPLVLVAASASLETRKLIQDLRPTYTMVRPVDPLELEEAVADAIARRSRRPTG